MARSLAFNPVYGRGVKYRCVQTAEVRSILLYGEETWTVWAADERVLAVIDVNIIHLILYVWHRNCAPPLLLWCRLHLTFIPVQRKLRQFGNDMRRPEGELIFGTSFCTHHLANCRPTMIKEDLERFGVAL